MKGTQIIGLMLMSILITLVGSLVWFPDISSGRGVLTNLVLGFFTGWMMVIIIILALAGAGMFLGAFDKNTAEQ